jgi:hypothetical protein
VNPRISVGPTKSFRLLTALVAGAILTGCSDTDGSRAADSEASPAGSPSPTLVDDNTLLYLDGTRLERIDIESGKSTRLARLPAPDVAASRSTTWIAYVVGTSVVADDFVESPVLHLRDVTSGEDIDVGPGFGPLWHPLDDRVAFLRPVEPRECDAETCRGGVTVAVVEPGGEARDLLPAGRWGLLAWTGDSLLVADGTDLSHTTIVGPNVHTKLDVPPSEIWDASPDGRWLVTVRGAGVQLARLDAGTITGSPLEVDLGDGLLGDGSWASDSSRFAATVRDRERTRVVVVEADDLTAHSLPGSVDAAGSVLWSPSGAAVSITRSAEGGRRLQAAYCPVDSGARCRGLFSWVQDVVLLRME